MRPARTGASAVGPPVCGTGADGIGIHRSTPIPSFRTTGFSSTRSAGVSTRRGVRLRRRTLAMGSATAATAMVTAGVTSARDTVRRTPPGAAALDPLDTRTAFAGELWAGLAVAELSVAAALAEPEASAVAAVSAAEALAVVEDSAADSMEAVEGTAANGLDRKKVRLRIPAVPLRYHEPWRDIERRPAGWAGELRLLLRERTKKSRRGGTPAARRNRIVGL